MSYFDTIYLDSTNPDYIFQLNRFTNGHFTATTKYKFTMPTFSLFDETTSFEIDNIQYNLIDMSAYTKLMKYIEVNDMMNASHNLRLDDYYIYSGIYTLIFYPNAFIPCAMHSIDIYPIANMIPRNIIYII